MRAGPGNRLRLPMYEEPPAMYELEGGEKDAVHSEGSSVPAPDGFGSFGVDLTVTVTRSQPQGTTLPGTASVVQTGYVVRTFTRGPLSLLSSGAESLYGLRMSNLMSAHAAR